MRTPGTGTIDERPAGSGKWRARAVVDGQRITLGKNLTRLEAEDVLRAYHQLRRGSELQHGITVDDFGQGFLDRREKRGVRSMDEDRNRWKSYITDKKIGSLAIKTLRRSDVIEWRDGLLHDLSARGRKGLSPQTVKNALNLLRQSLGEALDREIVNANVAQDVKLPRNVRTTQKLDLEGILLPAEQTALLAAVPAHHRGFVLFTLAMGIRWSEVSWLQWGDVTDTHVTIRRSRRGLATKSGKPRKLPLTSPARFALLDAQKYSPPSDSEWVFPGPRSGRPRKCVPKQWFDWVKVARIRKHVRFHDLRHTTATSLLAGWWGEKWSLEEVRRQLGHSSIQITERYARILDEVLDAAAARTSFEHFGDLRTERGAEGTPNGPGIGASAGKDCEAGVFVNRRSGVQIPKLAPNISADLRDHTRSAADLERTSSDAPFFSTLIETDCHLKSIRKAYDAALAGDESQCTDALAEAAALLTGGGSRD